MKISARFLTVLALLCVCAGAGAGYVCFSWRSGARADPPSEPSQSLPGPIPTSDPVGSQSQQTGERGGGDSGRSTHTSRSEFWWILWIGIAGFGTTILVLAIGFLSLSSTSQELRGRIESLMGVCSDLQKRFPVRENDHLPSRFNQDPVLTQIQGVLKELKDIAKDVEEVRSWVRQVPSGGSSSGSASAADQPWSPNKSTFVGPGIPEVMGTCPRPAGSTASSSRSYTEQAQAVRLFETDQAAFAQQYPVTKLEAKSHPGEQPFLFREDSHGLIWLFSGRDGRQNWAVPSRNIQITPQTYRDLGIEELFSCSGNVDGSVDGSFHISSPAIMMKQGDAWYCNLKGKMTVGSEVS